MSLADFGLSFLLEPLGSPVGSNLRSTCRTDIRVEKAGVAKNPGGVLIQTREYRAPEILFGGEFCARSDVWSLGCMVYRTHYRGEFLMDPKKRTRVEREMDVEHLAMMMQRS